MILIIGANAAITPHLIPFFTDKTIILSGRRVPDYIQEFSSRGIELQFIPNNYTNPSKVVHALPESKNLTVLFAGISSEPTLLVNLKEKQIESELLLNLKFSAELVSLLIPQMMSNRFGRFIFLGSKESSRGVTGGAIYAMIKQAQVGLSRTIAVECARFGITSNVLQLGLLHEGYSKKLQEKDIERMRGRIPTTSKLDYKDISNQISVLIEATAINGAVIDIDQAIR